ncbi:MFS transporter [Rhodococcus sp. 1R11]|uniref:MFS transporter n=1 Tax=Rhodococcus sp. 1R11 TaxID=2559614 RepID=UPI001072E0B1|nr:MFS transporter [Rhodococcus sp. 1R11]TFI43047.1 MFS transporter [Rhodococcus sp. 1R11]
MNDATFRTRLRESPGVGKLTTVRFAGQFGDGLFQAALSGAILFNPERATNPAEIAAGFAVLLVPYSLVGPFAGALLDRWDRRSVLLWANIVRIVLITATSVLLCAGVDATPLLLLALATVGLSRFVLAGASASLPHVVRQSWLVPMNSVLATVGSGFAAGGAGLAVAVIGAVGAGDLGSGVAVGLAATGSVVGAVAAGRFAPRSLGPDTVDRPGNPLKDVAAGLKSGALAVWRSPGVTTAMIGIGAHRIVFGINTLIMVLVLRESTHSSLPGGLAGFGIAVGATATGMFLAAVIAPFAVPRFGRTRTIATALVLAIAAQVGAVSGLTQTSLLLGAFLLGIAGQTVKLSGDAAMQIEIDDAHRGRVFALQDTVFNVAFVGALAAAAFAVGPDATELSQDPTAHALVFVGAGIYAVGFVAAILNTRRAPR